jgi:hypothetical protein
MDSILKIHGFRRNLKKFQKKNPHFKKIQKYVLFSCIRPNSKVFLCIFSKKQNEFLSCFKSSKWIS